MRLIFPLLIHSVPITTNLVSSNPVHGEVYSKQLYVICLSVTCEGRWFSSGIPASSTNKTDRQDITEILLKVPFNTINKQTNSFIDNNYVKIIVACQTDCYLNENSTTISMSKV